VNWKRREDDTEEIARRRLQHFHAEMDSLVSHYENQQRLMRFIPYNGLADLPALDKIVRDTIGLAQAS